MDSKRQLLHICHAAFFLALAQPVFGCIPLTLSGEVEVDSIDESGLGSANTGKFANFFQADAEAALGSTISSDDILTVQNMRTGDVKDFKSWSSTTVSVGDWQGRWEPDGDASAGDW